MEQEANLKLYTQLDFDTALKRYATLATVRRRAEKLGITDEELVEQLFPLDKVIYDDAGDPTNLDDLMGALHKRLSGAVATQQAAPPPQRTSSVVNPPTHSPAQASAQPTFTRTQLRDPEFFAKNEKAILEAAREGRISEE
jgi:hypothetical protein